MSLCYDFEKWTMITLASIAISLIIGLLLVNFAHGQVTPEQLWRQLNCSNPYDPFFPKTAINLCNLIHEKSVTGIDGRDDNALRQEFLQRYGDVFQQEFMNGLNQSIQKAQERHDDEIIGK